MIPAMPSNARQPGWLSAAVAAEIRAQLGGRGWKQIRLSRATGIPKGTLSSLLAVKSVIDLTQLSDIADALDIRPDDLIMGGIERAQAGELNTVYQGDGDLDGAQTGFARDSDEQMKRLSEEEDRRRGGQ